MSWIALIFSCSSFIFPSKSLENTTANVLIVEEYLEQEKKILSKIVHKFTKIIGTTGEVPKVHIAKEDYRNQLATYTPLSNQITFYPQLIHYAIQLDAADKDDLYHFLVGHELGHFYIEVNKSFFIPDFLTRSEARYRKEFEADFFSLFINLLAGRKTIKSNLPSILEQLYQNFSLHQTKTLKYPPLAVRKRADSLAILRADSLNNYFQLATQLSAINHPRIAAQFAPAIEIYDYLLHFFQASEFYNNRGILYFHRGIQENYGEHNKFERFFYPLELDITSKLINVRSTKKTTPLNETFFWKALADFQSAAKFGNNQERYLLNQANIHAILGRDKTALQILKNACLSNGDTEQLLTALIKLNQNKADTAATNLLKEIAGKGTERIHQLAQLNLAVLTDDKSRLPQFKRHITIPQLNDAAYTKSIDPSNIEVLPLDKTSTFSYGWATTRHGGKYFVIKRNNSTAFATFVLPLDNSLKKIKPYLPTHLGHNFETYLFTDQFTTNGIIFLEDQAVVVKNYSLH